MPNTFQSIKLDLTFDEVADIEAALVRLEMHYEDCASEHQPTSVHGYSYATKIKTVKNLKDKIRAQYTNKKAA